MYITDSIQNRSVLVLVADSIGHRTVLMSFADYIVKHQSPIFNQAARITILKNLQINIDLAQV